MRNALLLLFLGTLLFTSCVDKIEFKVPSGQENALVINGKLLYGQPSYIEVNIEKLFAFDAASRNRVPSCCVTLENDLGQRIELDRVVFSAFNLEIPLDHPDFEISFDRNYRIIVETLEEGSFESAWEPLFPVPRMDSISLIEVPTAKFTERLGVVEFQSYNFQVNTPLIAPKATQASRLLWLNETFNTIRPSSPSCNELNTIFIRLPTVFDGTINNASYLEDYFIASSKVQDLNGPGQEDQVCLVLYQQSLSETALNYWQQVIKVLERGDVDNTRSALGQVTSNISPAEGNQATKSYGYFYATQQDTLFFTKLP